MVNQERQLIRELGEAGFVVECVYDLFNNRYDYRSAIPLLLSWLPRTKDPHVKEGIVRALSVKWAKNIATQPLLRELKRAQDTSGTGIAWTIASAIDVVATDQDFFDVVAMAQSKTLGRAREMLVHSLRNMKKSPEVVGILIELLEDDAVTGHAIAALRKLNAKQAVTAIEAYLDDPRTLVRGEARKAIKKLSPLVIGRT